MAEYIDRHALKNDGHLCWHDGKGNTFYEVDHAPTADVVEVVRCEKCKYRTEVTECNHTLYFCRKKQNYIKLNDFCSYGERRESDV